MTMTMQNTELWTGDDIIIPSVILDEAGRPRDLTGATFTYSVRDEPHGTLLFPAKTLTLPVVGGPGVVVDDATAGTLHLVIVSADTIGAVIQGESRDYIHELEGVWTGRHDTLWTGRFRLWQSVSGAGA